MLLDILVQNNLVKSKGEGKRMISQGAVKVNNEKVTDFHYIVKPNFPVVIKVGKRRFLKII